MNLIIDQGNTAFKIALFRNDTLETKAIFENENAHAFSAWISQHITEPVYLIVSSVVNQKPDLKLLNLIQTFEIDSNLPLPIKVAYKSPETLGNDRLANACALWKLNPGKNSLSVDIGTCIKYDLMTSDSQYIGGAISPGLTMRFKALHEFTAKLPLVENTVLPVNIGSTTEESIAAGVKLGITHEINGFIERYSHDFDDLTIFMTGGDSIHFDKGFKKPIFANPDLTLIGLNEILQYNVRHK